MRVAYNWLKEYVDLEISPQELAERLTMAGIEVGSVETFGEPMPRVTVAEILGIDPHPRADNLTVVHLATGQGRQTVVCGAKNIAAGQKVPLALPGAVLPGLGGKALEAAEIRGVLSEGMLCSPAELGLELPGGTEGILILDPNAPSGARVDSLLEFDDHILTLELTPNRADCLGMLGVAFEAAALTGGRVRMPVAAPAEIDLPVEDFVTVMVEDEELCPRYTARVIREVAIGPSPLWMQLRLLKAGIRPISNIVDITNYVMLEYGQPLHAFDYQLLREGKIVVRRARQGEKLVTLDGVERSLDREVLVIADGLQPVGLAGVMGGENTEIGPRTREVLLEAALFHPGSIRRTARRFALPSEASQRFERGVNPEWIPAASDRAAGFMATLAGGEVLRGMIDVYPHPRRPVSIAVRPHRISEILGVKMPGERVVTILESLGFTVTARSPLALETTVPLRRNDVTIEEDVVEEVARLYGYENIPTTLPRGELVEGREQPDQRLLGLIGNTLVACGYHEVITYSFINPALLDRLRLDGDDERLRAIPLQNPLSEEQGVMRTTLLPGMLKTLQHNFRHQQSNQLLYEMGAVFFPRQLPLEELPLERAHLALAATGEVPEANWAQPSRTVDFFTVKGALEALFHKLGLTEVSFLPQAQPFLHSTRAARILVAGEEAGWLGQLHPALAEEYDFPQEVYVCELDLTPVLAAASPLPRYTPLPRYPSAMRDIAVIVSREIPAAELEKVIREAGGDLVEKVTLFDLYQGEQIPAGKRSLAFAIRYRSREGTLTDETVNRAHRRIEEALAQRGAVRR